MKEPERAGYLSWLFILVTYPGYLSRARLQPELGEGTGWGSPAHLRFLQPSHLGLQEAICLPELTGAPFFSTYSLLRNKRGIRSHEKRGRLQVSLVRSLPSWHGRAICTNDTSLGGKKEGGEERATPASNLCRSSLLQLLLSPTFNLPYSALALLPGSESGHSCGQWPQGPD